MVSCDWLFQSHIAFGMKLHLGVCFGVKSVKMFSVHGFGSSFTYFKHSEGKEASLFKPWQKTTSPICFRRYFTDGNFSSSYIDDILPGS